MFEKSYRKMDAESILPTTLMQTVLAFSPAVIVLALVIHSLLRFRHQNLDSNWNYDFHQETTTQIDEHGVTIVTYDHARRRKLSPPDANLQLNQKKVERAAKLAEQHRALHRRLSKDFDRKYDATWWSEYLPSPREWTMSLPQFGRRWSRNVPDINTYIIPRSSQQVINVVQTNHHVVLASQAPRKTFPGQTMQAVNIRMNNNGDVVLTHKEPRDAFAGQPKQAISGSPPSCLKSSGDSVIERRTRSGKLLQKGPVSPSLPRTSKTGNVRARHVFLSKQGNSLVI